MKPSEVLKALELGEKVRRKEWPQGDFVVIKTEIIIVDQDGDHAVFEVETNGIDKDVWEILDDKVS